VLTTISLFAGWVVCLVEPQDKKKAIRQEMDAGVRMRIAVIFCTQVVQMEEGSVVKILIFFRKRGSTLWRFGVFVYFGSLPSVPIVTRAVHQIVPSQSLSLVNPSLSFNDSIIVIYL
jgi:hypothetical protein